jgi:hypothetical protein
LVSLKAVSNNRYGFQKRDDGSSGLGGPVSTTQISTTQFQIVAVRRNPSQSRFEIWVDGVLEGSTPDDGDNFTPQPVVIGRHATNVQGGFNGDIAELLIYRNALTDAEFQSVGAYLEARYGLATAFPDTVVATPLAAGTPTSYFRKSFNFDGDPARTTLRLDHTVTDGAVFHLNGQEIARVNLAGGPVLMEPGAGRCAPAPGERIPADRQPAPCSPVKTCSRFPFTRQREMTARFFR